MNKKSDVKKVIGVISGKGGVGKSSITSMLAVSTQRMGYKTAIMDADITGPSIPKAFGLTQKALGNETEILPVTTDTGIKTISINSLLEDETDPVIWRGPVLDGVVEQFWNDVVWGDIDVMWTCLLEQVTLPLQFSRHFLSMVSLLLLPHRNLLV